MIFSVLSGCIPFVTPDTASFAILIQCQGNSYSLFGTEAEINLFFAVHDLNLMIKLSISCSKS